MFSILKKHKRFVTDGKEIFIIDIANLSLPVSPRRSVITPLRKVPVRSDRSFTPCRYCHRYDGQVEHINSDGLKGFYHPFCHSEVLRLMREELTRRMTNRK